MDSVSFVSFLDELEKIAASKNSLTVSKSRSGRRSMSVSTMLEKDKDKTLFKRHGASLAKTGGVSSETYKSVEELKAGLKPGDILVTRAIKPTLMSRVVSAVQGTEFGHTALYLGKGKVVDTRISGVVETTLPEVHTKWGGGRDIRVYRPQATDEQKEQAIATARSYVGTPYDKRTALRMLLPAAKDNGKVPSDKKDSILCSQLIVRAYPDLNFARGKARAHVLPVNITNSPLTKRIGELTLEKNADEEHKLHGHLVYQGIPIAIENRKGSVRKGVDSDGKPWKTTFKHPYGFIKKTEGKDGEEIDVYVGPSSTASHAFVVHQRKLKGGGHDEDKVMLGWKSEEDARAAYLDHYNKVGPKLLGPISTITIDDLKKKLDEKRKHTKLAAGETGGEFSNGSSDPFTGGVPGRKTDKLPTAEGTKAAEVDIGNTSLYGDRSSPKPPRKPGEVPDRDDAGPPSKLAWDGVGSGGSLGSGTQASLFTGDKPDRAKKGDVPSRDGNDAGALKPKHEGGPDFCTTIPAGGAQMSSQTGALSR